MKFNLLTLDITKRYWTLKAISFSGSALIGIKVEYGRMEFDLMFFRFAYYP